MQTKQCNFQLNIITYRIWSAVSGRSYKWRSLCSPNKNVFPLRWWDLTAQSPVLISQNRCKVGGAVGAEIWFSGTQCWANNRRTSHAWMKLVISFYFGILTNGCHNGSSSFQITKDGGSDDFLKQKPNTAELVHQNALCTVSMEREGRRRTAALEHWVCRLGVVPVTAGKLNRLFCVVH